MFCQSTGQPMTTLWLPTAIPGTHARGPCPVTAPALSHMPSPCLLLRREVCFRGQQALGAALQVGRHGRLRPAELLQQLLRAPAGTQMPGGACCNPFDRSGRQARWHGHNCLGLQAVPALCAPPGAAGCQSPLPLACTCRKMVGTTQAQGRFHGLSRMQATAAWTTPCSCQGLPPGTHSMPSTAAATARDSCNGRLPSWECTTAMQWPSSEGISSSSRMDSSTPS